MRKAFDSAITNRIQGQLHARQTRLKDQLKAVAAFPKELRRALPIYRTLCDMYYDEIPCTMGEEGYFVLDDIGEEGREEFETAQNTIANMIVALVVYVERAWSVSFGFGFRESSDNNFWDACPDFYKLSEVDGGWSQYAAAWKTHASRESAACRGKALINSWKREHVKARRAVDRYKQWWTSFWKAHPELAAQYEKPGRKP